MAHRVLERGKLLIVETGERSNLRWAGPVRILKNAAEADLAAGYRRAWTMQLAFNDSTELDPNGFLPWLLRSGYVEALDNVQTWHVGSYGEFNAG